MCLSSLDLENKSLLVLSRFPFGNDNLSPPQLQKIWNNPYPQLDFINLPNQSATWGKAIISSSTNINKLVFSPQSQEDPTAW